MDVGEFTRRLEELVAAEQCREDAGKAGGQRTWEIERIRADALRGLLTTSYALACQQRDDLLVACEALVEGIIWCGGSPSFASWGEAHEGWVKLYKSVIEPAVELIAGAKGGP